MTFSVERRAVSLLSLPQRVPGNIMLSIFPSTLTSPGLVSAQTSSQRVVVQVQTVGREALPNTEIYLDCLEAVSFPP